MRSFRQTPHSFTTTSTRCDHAAHQERHSARGERFLISTVDLASDLPAGGARILSQLGGRYETMVFRQLADGELDMLDLACARTDDLAHVDKQHDSMVRRWRQ